MTLSRCFKLGLKKLSVELVIGLTLVFFAVSFTDAAAPTKRVRILFADFSERMGLFFF